MPEEVRLVLTDDDVFGPPVLVRKKLCIRLAGCGNYTVDSGPGSPMRRGHGDESDRQPD